MEVTEFVDAINIATELEPDTLKKIGQKVVKDYNEDLASRADWQDRYKTYMKLAMQVVENKNFPWDGAANIKYPLLTTAGLQFHARAYPALVPESPVQMNITAKDEDGSLTDRADKVGKHMSYQLIDEMEEWEEDMDRLVLTYSFTGCEFKKTYFDETKGRPVSEHVSALDMVVNYWAKNINDVDRKTHRMFTSPNEVKARQNLGLWLKCDLSPQPEADTKEEMTTEMQGRMAPSTGDSSTPHEILEYHGYYDLDGDGYNEPYIITVDRLSKKVLRIVARFDLDDILQDDEGNIVLIRPTEYFTKFDFIPDPMGSIYGIGFGVLLAPINEIVNTTINQLVDSGTMSNLQAGFMSRNMRVKNGNVRLSPGEWLILNTTPEDLQKGVFPMPVNPPSPVLLSLLQYMVAAGERLSSTTDLMVGENPGQNQKAATSQIVREEGLKVFTAIYKRTRRAMTKEFEKLYRINSEYLEEAFVPSDVNGGFIVSAEDYQLDLKVRPAADPRVADSTQKQQRAQLLMEMMQTGGFNTYEVKKRVLDAAEVPAIEQVLPDPQGPNAIPTPPNIEQLEYDRATAHQAWQEAFDEWRTEEELKIKHRELAMKAAQMQLSGLKDYGQLEFNYEKLKADKENASDKRAGMAGSNEG